MALPEMLKGTVITLELTAGALVIGLAIGLPLFNSFYAVKK